MLRQILIGFAVSAANIGVHALFMAAVVTAARHASGWRVRGALTRLTGVMVAAAGALMTAHIIEVFVWASAYRILQVAPKKADALYFAFVSYTTLGYGDVLPVDRWRLLGPMTAMNGILLFGWSTAVIFEVLTQAQRLGAFADKSE